MGNRCIMKKQGIVESDAIFIADDEYNAASSASPTQPLKRKASTPSETLDAKRRRQSRADPSSDASRKMQKMFRLPGFIWPSRSQEHDPSPQIFGDHERGIWAALGACSHSTNVTNPAQSQHNVAVRVADILETCYDVYFGESTVDMKRDYVGSPLDRDFWYDCWTVLTLERVWWERVAHEIGVHGVYRVAMMYTKAWDADAVSKKMGVIALKGEVLEEDLETKADWYLRA